MVFFPLWGRDPSFVQLQHVDGDGEEAGTCVNQTQASDEQRAKREDSAGADATDRTTRDRPTHSTKRPLTGDSFTMSDPFANLNLTNPAQSQQAQQALAQLMQQAQQAQQGRNVQQGSAGNKQVDPRTVSGSIV